MLRGGSPSDAASTGLMTSRSAYRIIVRLPLKILLNSDFLLSAGLLAKDQVTMGVGTPSRNEPDTAGHLPSTSTTSAGHDDEVVPLPVDVERGVALLDDGRHLDSRVDQQDGRHRERSDSRHGFYNKRIGETGKEKIKRGMSYICTFNSYKSHVRQ